MQRNNLFKYVKVDVGGYGVVWNEHIDLSCNELWENGTPISQRSGTTRKIGKIGTVRNDKRFKLKIDRGQLIMIEEQLEITALFKFE